MTATSKIITWINESKHPIWWKLALRMQLDNPILKAEHYDLIYRTARKEAGFNEDIDDLAEFAKPISADGHHFEEYPVILLELGPTDNVASLANDQTLPFSPDGMTVIYGDNGVGKSSYAKILKNCCLTRGEKPPVVGNIFSDSASPSRATIRYKVGDGNETLFDWSHKNQVEADLKAIRVFDSKSAIHYVEKEGELAYRPAGLHLLDGLASACRHVRGEVDKKILSLSTADKLPEIDRATSTGIFLNSISHETTAGELNSHCASDADLASLETVQREIVEMKTKTAAEIKKRVDGAIKAVKPLIKTIDEASTSLNLAKLEQLSAFRKAAKDKTDSANAARAIAFGEIGGLTIGSPSWIDLWNAAKSFIENQPITLSFPPKHGEECPLCLQEISDATSDRLQRFEDYVLDQIQIEAKTARTALDKSIKDITDLTLDLTPYEATILQLDEMLPGITSQIAQLTASFVEWKTALLSEKDTPAELKDDEYNIGKIESIA